jgi:hypothetical protein
VRLGREQALVQRQHALPGRARAARVAQASQRAAAPQLGLGQVGEVLVRAHELAQGVGALAPALALALRDAQTEEHLGHHGVTRRLASHALEGLDGGFELVLAEARLAQQEHDDSCQKLAGGEASTSAAKERSAPAASKPSAQAREAPAL